MLCHADVVSETKEGRRRSLYMCMSACVSMYRCGRVSVVHVWLWCIDKHTGWLAYACTEVKRGHFQSFTLCPNSLETEVSLVVTKPQGSSWSAPYCTGVTGIHVATPEEWQEWHPDGRFPPLQSKCPYRLSRLSSPNLDFSIFALFNLESHNLICQHITSSLSI